jgi:4-amino-4-deoxy-L-arabinose transferase-like glycosyltransferase
MQQVIAVLLGAACSGGTSFCFGAFLLRKLKLELDRTEHAALAFVAGAACYSQLVFLLCAISLARPYVFIFIGLLAGVIITFTRGNVSRARFARFPGRWKWLFGALFAAFGTVYLVNALAPEMSPDGSAYHLPFVAHYLRAHGFTRIDQNPYASLPQGIDLSFLPAISLGGNSAASLVHFLFLIDLPLLMITYGRRFGFPLPAAAAAFLVFASPAFGWDGTSAYVDVAAATILFALFYVLELWRAGRRTCLLAIIGILAGFCFSAKYSAAIGIPYALGVMAWSEWRGHKPWLRPAFTIGCLAALFVLPWMIKNQIYSGNPLAPFANRLFPNSQLHASLEQPYLLDLQHYHTT